MSRRKRFVGLVVLATMVLSMAESAVAATCAPTTAETHAGVDMAAMPRPADHDDSGTHQHDPQHDSSPDGECPFSPAGGVQGCAASVFMPAAGVSVLASAHGAVSAGYSDQVAPNLLLGSALFHPPRP